MSKQLIHISEDDCLFDVDEAAWNQVVENRGGCVCHVAPPCNACTEPIDEAELNAVGYTYAATTSGTSADPADNRQKLKD